MSGKGDSRGQRFIDDGAKAVAGLRRGEAREDAAVAAGFSLMGLYGARHRDPAFRAAWIDALAASAAAERRVRAYAERAQRGHTRMCPQSPCSTRNCGRRARAPRRRRRTSSSTSRLEV
jgi:hypothetical protein